MLGVKFPKFESAKKVELGNLWKIILPELDLSTNPTYLVKLPIAKTTISTIKFGRNE